MRCYHNIISLSQRNSVIRMFLSNLIMQKLCTMCCRKLLQESTIILPAAVSQLILEFIVENMRNIDK